MQMPGTFTGMGRLEFAPTSTPDEPFPVWVDLTPYLRTETTALQITRGRQSELDQIQSSQLTCILDNTDNRFTPGYLAGPYGSNWVAGKQIRYCETVGARTFVQFTGHLEFPDVDSWQPIGYQEVALTAVDRLTRLARGKPFVSTLGAHIMGQYKTTLAGYWPMNDVAFPMGDASGQQPSLAMAPALAPRPPFVDPQFNVEHIALADDARHLRVGYDPSNYTFGSTALQSIFRPGMSIGAGQVVTVVAWLNPQNLVIDGVVDASCIPLQLLLSAVTDADTAVSFVGSSLDQWFTLATTGATIAGSSVGIPIANDAPFPVGMQFGPNPDRFDLWLRDQQPATTYLSAFASSYGVYGLYVPRAAYSGLIGHVQLYVGAPSDFTHADFLAQRLIGLYGLEQQFTGARINSILDYAGVPAGARAVDAGVSVMQVARLAGQSPAQALADAVGTERGRGFISGDGRYVFHDRIRVRSV